MECLLQYMDDLDDLAGALGLMYERVRARMLGLLVLCLGALMVAAGAWLALVHPPLAMATCILLFVILLYRSVTSPTRRILPTA